MKVLVATPVMRGELYKFAWLSWYAMDWPGRLDYYQMIGGDNDPIAYNNIVNKYNDAREIVLNNGYDALMTVESDNIVPKDALKRLVAADADVTYGVYVWKHGFPYWNCYTTLNAELGLSMTMTPEEAKVNWGKVIDVAGVGNGCTLIQRQVLEALEFKWAPGEFGCCDWHLSVDCQRLGFTQRMDLGLVCGHIATDPVYRILWPDPNEKGLYRMQLLEKWTSLTKQDKWLTGKEISVEGDMKVKALIRFHLEAGRYANAGEVIGVSKETGERLIRRGVAEPYKEKKKEAPKVEIDEPDVPEEILEPGLHPKEPCDGCDKKRK